MISVLNWDYSLFYLLSPNINRSITGISAIGERNHEGEYLLL